MTKILEIGNYPPPVCGWAMQTALLVPELRRRGHVCDVLNINERRRDKSPDFVDVQNGLDYLVKLLRFARAGYRFHMHVNAESPKGYLLAVVALLVGRLFRRPAALTFHGGLPQTYFPRLEVRRFRWAFQFLFRLAGQIRCNSVEIQRAIQSYGPPPERIAAIPGFSPEMLAVQPRRLSDEVETFLAERHPVFFCYVAFRPEYHLPVLRHAMSLFGQSRPGAGWIWLGFPAKELPAVSSYVQSWPVDEAKRLLLLGNLEHDEFLTLLKRCFASLRTPACDGVSSSVLESLALGVPVVASENGRRPPGVITYREQDAADLHARLGFLVEQADQVRARTRLETPQDNTRLTADWLLGRLASGV